ncbi:MAG: DMT family transporter [Chloroflexi bacterium]|nr:DMT family transporter [Chloroflexota bacterium]MYD48676.1 DMT family transporter [Chloroflexota bacterium]
MLAWGIADYLARSAAGRIGSVSTTLLTQLIGLTLPAVFVAAELATGEFRVDWPALATWAPLTGAVLGVGYLVYYTGLARGAVTVVSSAASAWLAVTILIAVAAFGERVASEQLALMAAILAGILLLSVGPLTGADVGSGLPWGLGTMLGIGVAMALFDRVTAAAGPMLAVLVVRALSTIPTFAFSHVRRLPIQWPVGGSGWLLLAAVGILDAAGYVGYNLGVASAPVSLVAPIAAAHPVATIALAVVINRERPRLIQWAGATLTVAATIGLSVFLG